MRSRRLLLICVLLAAGTALFIRGGWGARTSSGRKNSAKKGPIYQFLVSNRVPIDARIRVAKVSVLLKTRSVVRSVVKVIGPAKLTNPREMEELRKIIKKKMRKGSRIRFEDSKKPNELGLLRQNILAGEVIKFHASEKLGELELFFSRTQSLKVEIGRDMFYIRIGKRDCTFRSPSLRRQLSDIVQRR